MKKIKTFGVSLLPVCGWLAIQVLVSAMFAMLMILVPSVFQLLNINGSQIIAYIEQEYLYIVSVIMSAVCLIPGFFWYRYLIRGDEKKQALSFKVLLRLLLFGVCLQFAVSLILSGVEIVFPEPMEHYGEVMESLGMNSPSLWSVLYVGVFAPIAEELVFRGLTMKLLQKNFSFSAANMIQAFYFGLIHGNLVQGLYAFVIGCMFGKIVKKYGTIKSSIFCHLVVNISGLILGGMNISIITMAMFTVILMGMIIALQRMEGSIKKE